MMFAPVGCGAIMVEPLPVPLSVAVVVVNVSSTLNVRLVPSSVHETKCPCVSRIALVDSFVPNAQKALLSAVNPMDSIDAPVPWLKMIWRPAADGFAQ